MEPKGPNFEELSETDKDLVGFACMLFDVLTNTSLSKEFRLEVTAHALTAHRCLAIAHRLEVLDTALTQAVLLNIPLNKTLPFLKELQAKAVSRSCRDLSEILEKVPGYEIKRSPLLDEFLAKRKS